MALIKGPACDEAFEEEQWLISDSFKGKISGFNYNNTVEDIKKENTGPVTNKVVNETGSLIYHTKIVGEKSGKTLPLKIVFQFHNNHFIGVIGRNDSYGHVLYHIIRIKNKYIAVKFIEWSSQGDTSHACPDITSGD